MNNEIKLSKKEIIGICEFLKIHHFENAYTLLDYITNLQQAIEVKNERIKEEQQEKERYIKFYNELNKWNKKLQQENERLKEENFNLREYISIAKRSIPNKYTKDKDFFEILDMPTYEDYKYRCEKAIEQAKEKIKRYESYINDLKKGNYPSPTIRQERQELIFRIREQKDLLNILQNGSDEDEC